MSKEIIQYYEKLYESNPKRKQLSHDEMKIKICSILQIITNLTTENTDRIWNPKSTAKDYNGFSQKTIEEVIRGENLLIEIANYNNLLARICDDSKSGEIFLYMVSKSILFKKKENIRGGTDIRVINILPS